MERYYKALSMEGFIVRLIRIKDSIGRYDAFDLISDGLPHLNTFVLDPKPNIGWEEISLNEYSNTLLDTISNKSMFERFDKIPIPHSSQAICQGS